jgi:hypothetical protein
LLRKLSCCDYIRCNYMCVCVGVAGKREHHRSAVQRETSHDERCTALRRGVPAVRPLQRVVDLQVQRVGDAGVDLSVGNHNLGCVAEDPAARMSFMIFSPKGDMVQRTQRVDGSNSRHLHPRLIVNTVDHVHVVSAGGFPRLTGRLSGSQKYRGPGGAAERCLDVCAGVDRDGHGLSTGFRNTAAAARHQRPVVLGEIEAAAAGGRHELRARCGGAASEQRHDGGVHDKGHHDGGRTRAQTSDKLSLGTNGRVMAGGLAPRGDRDLQKRASRWHAELRSTSRKLLYNF